MIMLNKDNQFGRSMIEMLGVLAIIGVLSVGGISGYSKAMAKYKLTKAQDQITILLMNIRTAYATSPTYGELSATNAIQWNLAPSDMYSSSSASKLYNTFGGEVKISDCSSSNNNACGDIESGSTYFGIQMEGLSNDACRSLASADWGTDGLMGIKINDASSHTTTDLPISLGTASNECNKTDNTNVIAWVYY